jgi:valyl-tRNA synthetase
MSKSLGTGIDPRDLIDGGPRPPVFSKDGEDPGEFPAYGADAVRWGLLAMSSGQDVRFNEEKVSQGQQLTNKLWNASRLILLRVDPETRAAARPQTPEDHWILSRLERSRSAVAEAIDEFEFSRASLALYDFIYGELCDWYLELVKPRLWTRDPDLAPTLLHVLTEALALAHPLLPFETEELYSHIPGAEGLLAARVAGPAAPADDDGETAIASVIGAVQAMRAWRDTAEVKAGATVSARLQATGYAETADHLARLARLDLDGAEAHRAGENGEIVATVPIPGGAIEVMATDALDPEAAARRLARRRAMLEDDVQRAEHKLANAGFVAKAPPAVVEGEREKLRRLRAELEAL